MNRATKKALALAVGGLCITNFLQSTAQAQVDTWQTTGSGNSQDWFTGGNWSGGVPTSTSTAYFSPSYLPPSSSGTPAITLDSNSTSVGAIIDDLADASSGGDSLNIYGTNSTLTLTGVNYVFPNSMMNNTIGTINETNVVLGALATTVATSSNIQTLDMKAGVTISLPNANNTIIASDYYNASKGNPTGQEVQIDGQIVNGSATPASLYIGGGGSEDSAAGQVFLHGNSNTYSGGTVVGQPNNVDSAVLEINADAINVDANGTFTSVASTATGTGNITVNEGSQLLLNGNGTNNQTLYFMNTNTTLTLNGIGVGATSSGALRTNNGSATAQTYDILANVVLGDITPLDNGIKGDTGVVLSPTSEPQYIIQFSGPVTTLPGYTGFDKQGSGTDEFSNPDNQIGGFTQIGNGGITVDPGCTMGTGDLIMFQTGSNTTFMNFENQSDTIGNLSSQFTKTAGSYPQQVFLYGTGAYTTGNTGTALSAAPGSGTTLYLNQTSNTSFGYGDVSTLLATISGAGVIQLNANSTGTLSLTGPNTYTGDTIINGGTLNVADGNDMAIGQSATGTVGDVIVNSGGALSSGGGVSMLSGGAVSTSGTVGGEHDGTTFTNLTINSGGLLLPGGANLAGTLYVGGNLNLTSGSITNIDLIGGTNAQSDYIDIANALNASSTAVLNVLGSKLAFGNYTLFNYNSLTGGNVPEIGSKPNPGNRTYSLVPVGDSLVLEIVDTGTDQFWSVAGGANPPTDGGQVWLANGTNFFIESNGAGTAGATYNNTDDLIIGNAGVAGNITLGSNVVVGGAMLFNNVSGTYTISGVNTLQLNGGIASSTGATITAPVVLGASQTFTTAVGTTLTISGGISETLGSRQLTTGDLGTIILGGVSSYSGGTVISQGTLEVTDAAALPSANGVQIASGANLVFAYSASGGYSGAISGSGGVTIANTGGAATSLSSANTYTGSTTVQSGTLQVANVNAVGGGVSSLLLDGGTLQAIAPGLNFPGAGDSINPNTTVTLVPGNTSYIDTNGNNVTMNQYINGAGSFVKVGQGTLTWTGLSSTTVLGTVGIAAGTLTLDPPPGTPSFGFAADPVNSNTYTGDLTIAALMDLRLQGGNFSGGGNINIIPSNIDFDSHGFSYIGNNINLNPTNLAGFSVSIYATKGNLMDISGNINGTAAVNFSGGSGPVFLEGTSTYSGPTLIDTGPSEVRVAVANALPVSTDVTITGASSGSILDLYGVNQTIDSLSATSDQAIVMNQNTNAMSPATLIINGTMGAVTTYNGLLEDGQVNQLSLTLASTNTGSLTLSGDNQIIVAGVDEGPTGLTGSINVLGGRLDITNSAALGDPSIINVGANGQLHFNGVTSLTFPNVNSATNPAPPIVLTGPGGYQPPPNVSSGEFEPGNLDVVGGVQLQLANQITVNNGAAGTASGINIGTNSTLTMMNSITGPGGLVVTANNGGGVLNFTVANNYTGGTTLMGATTNVSAANGLPFGGSVINSGGTLAVTASQTIRQITGTGPSNAITAGALSISNGALVTLQPNGRASTVGALSIVTGSTLDITNNKLVISYGAATDPVASIAAALKTGAAFRASGFSYNSWNGTGIVSSTIAAVASSNLYNVGYLDGNNAADNRYGDVAPNQILVEYTVQGNAFLESSVGNRDLQVVAANYGTGSGEDWSQGSFDYSGSVGNIDLQAVAAHYGSLNPQTESVGDPTTILQLAWDSASTSSSAPSLSIGQSSSVVGVPEPGSMALVAAGAGALLARRRRRRLQ